VVSSSTRHSKLVGSTRSMIELGSLSTWDPCPRQFHTMASWREGH
jgi:hypothetical protein